MLYLKKASAIAGAVFALSIPATANAETRGYVISWFATATNIADFKASCPEDRNKGRVEWYIRDLVAAGYTKEEATQIIATAADSVQLPQAVMRKMEGRARINGKPASIYNYPDALEDPNVETVTGKFAYGFDLGSPNKANKFEDPETHQPVDDQLWRAVGCLESFRAVPPVLPYMEGGVNNDEGGSMPVWALQITGDDLTKDGKVTLTLSLTTQHIERDANGEPLRNVSYVVDKSPRSYNVLQGEIKNGVLSITPAPVHIEGTSYGEINIRDTHMRIRAEADKLVGYWGGYIKWLPYVYNYTSRPSGGADTTGLYHAVKKMADASPDPKTGQNTEISTTYRMEAVPAFLLDETGAVLAKPGTVSAITPLKSAH